MAANQLMLHQLTVVGVLDLDNRAHRCPAVERSAVDDLGPLQQLIEPGGSDGQDDLFLLNLQVVVIPHRSTECACLSQPVGQVVLKLAAQALELRA